MIPRTIAITAMLWLAGPAAHAQWSYDFDEDESADWAFVDDLTGVAQLEFYCDEFEWWLTIYTGEDYDDSTVYAPVVPLTLTVGGGTPYEFVAAFGEMDDEVIVEIDYSRDPRVLDLAAEIAEATDTAGTIEASFFNYSYTFPLTHAPLAVGAFMDICS